MKIAYIVNTRMPNQRAHGFQIAKTCEKFAALGNDVLLLHPYRWNDVTEDVFDYYGLKKNFKVKTIPVPDAITLAKYLGVFAFYLQSLFFSFKLFFERLDKNSIIYTRDIFIVLIFQLRGYKTVYNVHNWSIKRKLFSKLFWNKKFKVVCNSEGMKKTMMEEGFNNIIAVPNGVDLEDYAIAEDALEIRKRLNLPADQKIATYVGNLYQWKGISVILQAARLMIDANVSFVIVGGDKDDLKKYSKEAAGIENILFVGHKQKKDIPLYLKSANVLLLPNSASTQESQQHTSPIKMFEYMASGVPIVASDLPSIREVLNPDNAFLTEPDDAGSLAEEIKKVFENPSIAKEKANRAFEDVKKYTWDEYAKRITSFIRS